jgi:excisionase family DNA binding protein
LATIVDAAQYVGVHPKTVRRWIARGQLTGLRAGPRLIRVDLNELDVMLLRNAARGRAGV